MRPSRRDIVIATRRSALALIQSRAVGERLNQLNPRVGMRLVELESDGDRVKDHPLANFGGKGLFTRSIEDAVLDGRADIAVHSLKDIPTEETTGLVLAAIPARRPAHDVLIARNANTIEELPSNAVVGTCSPRRAAQLLRIRNDLKIVPLRGNVDTRIRKVLEEGEMDATLLAAAGLLRLGLDEHAANAIPISQILPAAGQGAVAIQCRADDHTTVRRCLRLNDSNTTLAVGAERRIAAALGADCHSPLAAYAECFPVNGIRLTARVLAPDGSQCLEASEEGSTRAVSDLVDDMANQLIAQGATEILAKAAETGISQSIDS